MFYLLNNSIFGCLNFSSFLLPNRSSLLLRELLSKLSASLTMQVFSRRYYTHGVPQQYVHLLLLTGRLWLAPKRRRYYTHGVPQHYVHLLLRPGRLWLAPSACINITYDQYMNFTLMHLHRLAVHSISKPICQALFRESLTIRRACHMSNYSLCGL